MYGENFISTRGRLGKVQRSGVQLSEGLAPLGSTEIISESYYINMKSDFIYHFPIDLEPNGRGNLCGFFQSVVKVIFPHFLFDIYDNFF